MRFFLFTVVTLVAFSSASAQPMFSQTRLPAPTVAEDERFGLTVAVDGRTALVQSARASVVQVYDYQLGLGWVAGQTLMPSENDDVFYGSSIYLDEDYALIGSSSENGFVEVYRRSASSFTFLQRLTASDGERTDLFYPAARTGNDILVGAFGWDGPQGESSFGAVYVFRLTGGQFVEIDRLEPSTPATAARFGVNVVADGDVALITADDNLPLSNDGPGSVYVFQRNSGTWTQVDRLRSSSPDGGDNFGSDLALEGNRALIGEQFADTFGTGSGTVFVYEDSGAGFVEVDTLVPSNIERFDQFGIDVDLVGNRALVGTSQDFGAAYLFELSGGDWTELERLLPEMTDLNALFGFQVSLTDEFALVGAPREDVNGVLDAGTAYVFDLTGRLFANGFE